MFDLTNGQQKITNHLANFVQLKDQTTVDLSDVKKKLSENDTKCESLCNEINALKTSLGECVNNNDINELVDDIRKSFELFLNNTPRSKDDEVENQLKILNNRLKYIEDKMSSVFASGEIEIISADVPRKCSSKVPKLEIKKK